MTHLHFCNCLMIVPPLRFVKGKVPVEPSDRADTAAARPGRRGWAAAPFPPLFLQEIVLGSGGEQRQIAPAHPTKDSRPMGSARCAAAERRRSE